MSLVLLSHSRNWNRQKTGALLLSSTLYKCEGQYETFMNRLEEEERQGYHDALVMAYSSELSQAEADAIALEIYAEFAAEVAKIRPMKNGQLYLKGRAKEVIEEVGRVYENVV